MDKLRSMQVFREVIRQGSFSAAADSLQLVNSAVSRQVTELEQWLDVKLLYRTTRSLSLTDEGRLYLERFEALLDSVDELEQQASSSHQEVKGTLNITTPLFLGRYLLEPMLPDFMQRYPEVKLSLLLVDRFVDLFEEGYDLAVRVGDLPSSNLIARQVGMVRIKAVASPEYLKRNGTPDSPKALHKHNCLYDSVARHNRRWVFKGFQGEVSIPINGNLVINSGEMVCQMAIEGLGITYIPDFFVDAALADGRLVEVLSDYTQESYPISLVYPHNRHMNLALRTFIDELVGKLT